MKENNWANGFRGLRVQNGTEKAWWQEQLSAHILIHKQETEKELKIDSLLKSQSSTP